MILGITLEDSEKTTYQMTSLAFRHEESRHVIECQARCVMDWLLHNIRLKCSVISIS